MKPVAKLQEVFQGAVLASDPAPGLFVREGSDEIGGFDLPSMPTVPAWPKR
ncbi:MAG: hypothetical protein IPO13_08285 [Rhodocyclaceae bacterium]|nr:hypothetical protein [Rhodocyclaceae bacterium]